MKKLALYPTRAVQGQSFVGDPVFTKPDESLSLKEILKRYVRGERLPSSVKDGYYESRFPYDLEKIPHLDITQKMAIAEEMKAYIDKAKEEEKARLAKEKAEAEAALAAQKAPVQGAQSPASDSPSQDKKP